LTIRGDADKKESGGDESVLDGMLIEEVAIVRQDVDDVAVQKRTEEDRDVIASQLHVRGALQSALILPAGQEEPIPIPHVLILQSNRSSNTSRCPWTQIVPQGDNIAL